LNLTELKGQKRVETKGKKLLRIIHTWWCIVIVMIPHYP